MTMCSSETVAVFCGCTMVWTTTDVRESSCYDYDDHSTEIESKRLSYFLKSALAHAFFYTTKDTTFSKASSSSSPGASAKVAFMWPFLPLWKYRQFSWAKNISSWKMHRMWWKRLCSDYTYVVCTVLPAAIKSLSVCTWKKLQKPQICAQAVGIMYNTYGNFFVLAGYCIWKEKNSTFSRATPRIKIDDNRNESHLLLWEKYMSFHQVITVPLFCTK